METPVRLYANPGGERSQRLRFERRRALEIHEPLGIKKRQRNLVLHAGNGLHPVRWPPGMIDDSCLRSGHTDHDAREAFRSGTNQLTARFHGGECLTRDRVRLQLCGIEEKMSSCFVQ